MLLIYALSLSASPWVPYNPVENVLAADKVAKVWFFPDSRYGYELFDSIKIRGLVGKIADKILAT